MGMAEVGVPLILGGLGAAGSALSGGAEGRIGSFGRGSLAPTRRDLDPTMLGRSAACGTRRSGQPAVYRPGSGRAAASDVPGWRIADAHRNNRG